MIAIIIGFALIFGGLWLTLGVAHDRDNGALRASDARRAFLCILAGFALLIVGVLT